MSKSTFLFPLFKKFFCGKFPPQGDPCTFVSVLEMDASAVILSWMDGVALTFQGHLHVGHFEIPVVSHSPVREMSERCKDVLTLRGSGVALNTVVLTSWH